MKLHSNYTLRLKSSADLWPEKEVTFSLYQNEEKPEKTLVPAEAELPFKPSDFNNPLHLFALFMADNLSLSAHKYLFDLASNKPTSPAGPAGVTDLLVNKAISIVESRGDALSASRKRQRTN